MALLPLMGARSRAARRAPHRKREPRNQTRFAEIAGPAPSPAPPERLAAPPRTSRAAGTTTAPPRAPQPPLRDRFWSTLLSERTLQAVLFLGIFLLFAAAISFVFWGWKDFSAPLRVAIPTNFYSLLCLALGCTVRTQTRMYRSAHSRSPRLPRSFIPIDFYTLYIISIFHLNTRRSFGLSHRSSVSPRTSRSRC